MTEITTLTRDGSKVVLRIDSKLNTTTPWYALEWPAASENNAELLRAQLERVVSEELVEIRKKAYAWLQQALGLLPHECHLGMFEPDQCAKVLRVLKGLPATGAVYVDFLVQHGFRFGGVAVTSCHLFTDTINLEPLHAIAAKIGMKPSWFDNRTGFPHYDLVESKRKLACIAGAVPLDTRSAFIRVYRPVRALCNLWTRPKE
jgi:hypothetical protein